MTCDWVTLDGTRAIVCHSRKPKRCQCGRRAPLLCDWKVEGGTCDAPICERCTTRPAPDKDLCPTHARAFEAWKEAKRKEKGDDVDS